MQFFSVSGYVPSLDLAFDESLYTLNAQEAVDSVRVKYPDCIIDFVRTFCYDWI